MIGTLSGGKIYIFGFFKVSYACSSMAKAFHQVLDDQKGQKHHEITFLPLFAPAGSTCGRMKFSRGK